MIILICGFDFSGLSTLMAANEAKELLIIENAEIRKPYEREPFKLTAHELLMPLDINEYYGDHVEYTFLPEIKRRVINKVNQIRRLWLLYMRIDLKTCRADA